MVSAYTMDYSMMSAYAMAIVNSALSGIFTEYYITTKESIYLCGAIFCNVAVIFNYIAIFAITGVAKGYAYIKILSIMCVAIYGVATFHEKMNNYSIIGLILGAGSIMLLNAK
jgi:drug/metabolite transporter (DMT)-like permease